MADPFEVRMRFTSQLQHLSASATAAQKAANYALKNREMDEDLHSCILEQLERNSMNNRANIMYFISHLCDSALREHHPAYIHMIQRDIVQIIDAVAPADGSGAANIRVVRRVLSTLQQKSVLEPTTVSELSTVLDERDTAEKHAFMTGEEVEGTAGGGPGSGRMRLGKREIEQRIEEDRERHKRLREEIWKVDSGVGVGVLGGVEGLGETEEELRRLWEGGSEIGEDDYQVGREDLGERAQAVEFGLGV